MRRYRLGGRGARSGHSVGVPLPGASWATWHNPHDCRGVPFLPGLFSRTDSRVASALRDLASEQFASATSPAPTAKAAELLREEARPTVGGVLNVSRKSEADTLTPARLATIMREADQGNIEPYLTLAEEMEEREPHYRSVVGTRKMAVSGTPFSVKSASDSAHDKAIADHVELILQRPATEGLVLDLMDAVAKSFSCVEIMWDRSGKSWEPLGYEHRSQRFFVFDRDTRSTPLLQSLNDPFGVPLTPFKWLVHVPKLASGIPIRCGLARPAAIAYAAKRYTVADWLAFLDVFGMPIRVGKYPASMVSKKAELLRAVRAIGSDAAAVIPAEMSIEFIEAKGSAGGQTLFQASAEYWDKQISKVVLGQTMSSDDGASLAQSKTHERVRFDIKKADARSVAATINRDLIKPFVLLNYGPQVAYPEIVLQTDEPEDRTALISAVKVFVGLGGKVEMSVVRDRMGFPEPAPDAELLRPETVVAAEMSPKPAPASGVGAQGPAGDGLTPGDGAVAEKPAPSAPAAESDSVGADKAGGAATISPNAVAAIGERFARLEARLDRMALDVIDDLGMDALSEWRQLAAPIASAIAAVSGAPSFDAARAVLTDLASDTGDVLDVSAVTRALSIATFTSRGVGDATDVTET